jgi:hypothetical protein
MASASRQPSAAYPNPLATASATAPINKFQLQRLIVARKRTRPVCSSDFVYFL